MLRFRVNGTGFQVWTRGGWVLADQHVIDNTLTQFRLMFR